MARGEVVIVVGDDTAMTTRRTPGGSGGSGRCGRTRSARARAEVERLVADGAARGDAARRVATTTGIPRRRLYGADAAG